MGEQGCVDHLFLLGIGNFEVGGGKGGEEKKEKKEKISDDRCRTFLKYPPLQCGR